MKVIWVSPALPHPAAAGGWAHEFELIQALSADHDIHVVSSDIAGPLDESAILACGARFTRVPWRLREHPTGKIGVALHMLVARPNLILWLRRDRIPQLANAIQEIVERDGADLVQITLGELAPLVTRTNRPTGILLFDSLTREIESRLAIEPLARRRLQQRVERFWTRRFERRWYKRAAGLAAVSSVDAEWFSRLLDRRVETIENPIAHRFFEAPQESRTSDEVVFVGTLNHHPNTDAIEWLVQDIWPHVMAQRPDARLRVVGRGDVGGRTTARLRDMVEAVGGELHADVDEILPYYWRAAVVVAPMRLGAGLRNKVLHAMACRAPVVATPVALEGVPASAARHCWEAASAGELADAVVAVLDDPLAAQARSDVAASGLESLRTPVIAARHEAWWKSLCI